MIPIQLLPDNYHPLRTFDLTKEPKLLLLLNLAGLLLFGVFGSLLFIVMVKAHPEIQASQFSFSGDLLHLLGSILKVLLAYAGSLILHEMIHGICFWLVTRSFPKFGLGSAYAFAAAPDWYIPRNPYVIVGLAPLVVITAAGLALLPALPANVLLVWWFVLTVNASGAVGDMFVAGWLLLHTSRALINDHGDRINVYAPAG